MRHIQAIRSLMVTFRKGNIPLPTKIILTKKAYEELIKELDSAASMVTSLKLYGIEIEKGNV
jgi:hypothetical protein